MSLMKWKGQIFTLGALMTLVACSPPSHELDRSPNLSRTIDAVTVERDTEATVATPTEIYLSLHNHKASGSPVFRADKVEGLQLQWLSPTRLLIRAQAARVFLRESSCRVTDSSFDVGVKYEIAHPIP